MTASQADPVPRPSHTQPVPLGRLVPAGGELVRADPGTTVQGITASSDRVRPGDVFAAIPGRLAHGAAYGRDALAAGAAAVLTDPAGLAHLPADAPALVVDDVRPVLGGVSAQVYGDPARRLRMLGVTGTSGKTTTTFLMRAGLQTAGRATGLIGTVATMIGDAQVKTGFTTPEAPDLQALLAVMLERGVTDLAMEVSSHALTMGRVGGIDFQAAGFTNLSEDHLDFHTDMQDYFEAKAGLFEHADVPVIVVDDRWGRTLLERYPSAASVATDADDAAASGIGSAVWRAHDVQARPDGSTVFRVLGPLGEFSTGCAIPGRYNVANVVLALALLDAAGVPAEQVAPAVAAAQVPGRMERVDAGQPFLAVVDYSHKPAAVDGALRALRPLTTGRLIVVLGCGGDRDRGKRPHMGEIAARGADLLVVTDDNPRSERPADIRAAMLAGALAVPVAERGEVVEVGERAEAIRVAVRAARPGDTVLIAGKGHETGQEIDGVTEPFDDRDELRAALGGDA